MGVSQRTIDAIRAYAPTAASVVGTVLTGNPIVGGLAGKAVDALANSINVTGSDDRRITIERVGSKILDVMSGQDTTMTADELRGRLAGVDAVIAKLIADHAEAQARLDNEDRADARAHFAGKTDWGQILVAVAVILMTGAVIYFVFFKLSEIKDPNVALIAGSVVGAVTTFMTSIVQFWFGSSAGSKRAGETVRQIATEK